MVLEGKVAAVTGGTAGIGLAIAEAFLAEGAKVTVMARNEDKAKVALANLDAGDRCVFVQGDAMVQADVEGFVDATIQAFGSIDILVNNAGVSKPVPLLKMSEDNWDLHMDVNAKSVFLCSKSAIQQMKDSGNGGSVINIGSIVGENAIPETLGYCASKATINHMTRVMAVECAKYKVRVNCVAPGYVRTELIEELVADGRLALSAIEKRTPQRRMGELDDIAKAIIYVASEDASFMTGSILTIDGGWSAYGYL